MTNTSHSTSSAVVIHSKSFMGTLTLICMSRESGDGPKGLSQPHTLAVHNPPSLLGYKVQNPFGSTGSAWKTSCSGLRTQRAKHFNVCFQAYFVKYCDVSFRYDGWTIISIFILSCSSALLSPLCIHPHPMLRHQNRGRIISCESRLISRAFSKWKVGQKRHHSPQWTHTHTRLSHRLLCWQWSLVWEWG